MCLFWVTTTEIPIKMKIIFSISLFFSVHGNLCLVCHFILVVLSGMHLTNPKSFTVENSWPIEIKNLLVFQSQVNCWSSLDSWTDIPLVVPVGIKQTGQSWLLSLLLVNYSVCKDWFNLMDTCITYQSCRCMS